MPYQLKRKADGAVFEYDTPPAQVPEGFEPVGGGPLAAPQQPQGSIFSSPKGFYGPGIFANVKSRVTGESPQSIYERQTPQMERAAHLAGSLVAPSIGAGVMGPLLGGAAGQAAMSGGIEALSGRGPLEAAKSGAASGALAAGTGLAVKGALKAGSSLRLGKFAEERARDATAWLMERIPWIKGSVEPGAKGLKDALYGPGYDLVHQGYDESLKEVAKRGAGQPLTLAVEEARKLGLKALPGAGDPAAAASIAKSLGLKAGDPQVAQTMQALGIGGPSAEGIVQVDAAEAAKAITGQWKKFPELYRSVANQLDEAGIGDPASRAAYKTWVGAREYLNGMLNKGPLDIMKAQQGLGGLRSDVLNRRGLEGLKEQLMPGGEQLKQGNLRGPLGTLGSVAGAIGGFGARHFGLGHMGALGGAMGGGLAGGALGARIPTYNIPPGPLGQAAQQLAPRIGGALGGMIPTSESTE